MKKNTDVSCMLKDYGNVGENSAFQTDHSKALCTRGVNLDVSCMLEDFRNVLENL